MAMFVYSILRPARPQCDSNHPAPSVFPSFLTSALSSMFRPATGIIYLCTLLSLSLLFIPNSVSARGSLQSRIRVIHASSGTSHIDPALNDLAHELQSVFKYTAYHLISSKPLSLNINAIGTVPLPGGRTLELRYKGHQNGRIQLAIRILKNRHQVFTTDVLLRNQSSITIGGPKFKNGYLLFNISGKAN